MDGTDTRHAALRWAVTFLRRLAEELEFASPPWDTTEGRKRPAIDLEAIEEGGDNFEQPRPSAVFDGPGAAGRRCSRSSLRRSQRIGG
jgi:hypothetical protein